SSASSFAFTPLRPFCFLLSNAHSFSSVTALPPDHRLLAFDLRPLNNLSIFFLAEGEQTADSVMARLTAFIRAAKQSLDIAVYDMRFSDSLRTQLLAALREGAAAGVQIRFCYDGDKPPQPNVAAGQDPAPAGTSAFI